MTPQAIAAASTTIAVGKLPSGLAAAGGFVYTANHSEKTLSVIAVGQPAVVQPLNLPEGQPGSLAASHDGKFLFVLNPPAGKLHIYAPGQNQALLQTIDVGKWPSRIQLSPDDRKAWISLQQEDAIVELSFAQGLAQPPVMRKLATGKFNPADDYRMLAQGLNWLAVPDTLDQTVSLVNPASGESLRIPAGGSTQPAAVGIGSWEGQDRMLLIGNQNANTLTLYHLDSKLAISLQNLGQNPADMVVVPELTRAFVSMSDSNEVAVIDYRQQKLLARIAVGQKPMRIYNVSNQLKIQHAGHEHAEIWVCNENSDSVTVIDGEELKVKATIPVGRGIHELAFWSEKAYVSNYRDGSVSVIDRSKLGQAP